MSEADATAMVVDPADIILPPPEATEGIEVPEVSEATPVLVDQPSFGEESLAEFDQPGVSADLETQDVDAELEEMKQRLAQMEAESANAKGVNGAAMDTRAAPVNPAVQLSGGMPNQIPVDATTALPSRIPLSQDNVSDVDTRSIYVGNVDYAATGDQLSAHFADCGTINRVTIMCNKATGMPKGFAYIEFADVNAAQNALILTESTFLGRPLKVVAKRTNVPMPYRGGYRGGRGRFNRGRGYSRRPRRAWRGRWTPY